MTTALAQPQKGAVIVSQEARQIITALIRGLKFTVALLEKVSRGEQV